VDDYNVVQRVRGVGEDEGELINGGGVEVKKEKREMEEERRMQRGKRGEEERK
jgi:hypothetical protein